MTSHSEKRARYHACIKAGMTLSEVMAEFGVTRTYLLQWEGKHGAKFSRADEGASGLTPSQFEDYKTYIKAGILSAEAIAKATAPRVKIRAVPKGVGAK